MRRPGGEPVVKITGPLEDALEIAGPMEEALEIAESSEDTARPNRWRLGTDPETAERDLSRLVLTLVELVRQLVERQCVRRMDQGDLSDEQVETLGLTLMRLEDAMNELCDRFGLSPSDLNLDLGPLGTLLPAD
jgi:ParB-like chromosome segregation protein Spo0J